jgi:AhpD family alkylhydroperoxidase
MNIYNDQVNELVAIGAAIAANCEPCFKYHYDAARRLGVEPADMLAAVRMAQAVKETPARHMLELAGRFLGEPIQSASAETTKKAEAGDGKCC